MQRLMCVFHEQLGFMLHATQWGWVREAQRRKGWEHRGWEGVRRGGKHVRLAGNMLHATQ